MKSQHRNKIFKIIKKVISITISLLILLIGLDLIKHSIISGFHQEFLSNFFGAPIKSFFISYLMTEITMSWSPIAGAFISLWSSLQLTMTNLSAIIMWTRGGVNSFLLITGILMLFKWKSLRRALWITVIQFFVTFSITILAAVIIIPLLKFNIFETVSQHISNWFVINSVFENITWFFAEPIKTHIQHKARIIIIGLISMIWGLFLFDKSFSFLSNPENKEKLHKFETTKTAFASGFLITALTMSLSISVTILLPLYLRKVIDRKILIAYILGANISTLFDTLFLGIMTKSTLGINVILTFLLSVCLAVGIYTLIFKVYYKTIGHITDKILSNKYIFLAFTIIVMIAPILFLL